MVVIKKTRFMNPAVAGSPACHSAITYLLIVLQLQIYTSGHFFDMFFLLLLVFYVISFPLIYSTLVCSVLINSLTPFVIYTIAVSGLTFPKILLAT